MRRRLQPDLLRERAAAYYLRLRHWQELRFDHEGGRLKPKELPEAERPHAPTIALIQSGAAVEIIGWAIGEDPGHEMYWLEPTQQ